MKRRDFLAATAAASAFSLAGARIALAADGTIQVITGSDQNVADFWTTHVIPSFEAANPGVKVNLTLSADGNSGMMAIADRAKAAMASGADPQVDLMEGWNPVSSVGSIEAGQWVKIADAGLSNWAKVNPAAIDTGYGAPYRGSQVVLAYDSNKVATPPKTWEELVAWIKANPGQFIYNRPDKGGSGGNFVRRAIHEANGRDPGKFTVGNFSPEAAEAALKPAWDMLNDLAPSLYQKGAYTAGNTPSLQLLAQGAVSMIPTWSDMALSGLAKGELPPHIKIAQLQDLAFVGGFAYCAVPSNATQKDNALKLVDHLLSPEIQEKIIAELGGFPAIGWENLSPETREKYASVVPQQVPTFPEGDWEAATNDGWYRTVAPGIARD